MPANTMPHKPAHVTVPSSPGNQPRRSVRGHPRRQAAVASLFLGFMLCTLSAIAPGQALDDPGANLKRQFDAAKTFLVAGDLPQAENNYRQAIVLGLRQLSNLDVAAGRVEQAAGLLDGALKIAPDDADLGLDAAVVSFRHGDLKKARSMAEAVLAARPNHARAHNVLGRIAFVDGDASGAVRELKAALATKSDFETAYLLALADLRAKNQTEASVLFSEMIVSMGESAGLHVLIGRAYASGGYSELAMGEYRNAIQLDPKYPHAHALLGFSTLQLYDQEAYPQARKEFEEELKLQPDEFLALLWLGVVASGQHDYTTAETSLEHATRARPDEPDPYFYLGEMYTQTGRPQQAADALQKYVSHLRNPAEHRMNLGRAYFMLGQALLRIGREEEGKKALARSQQVREEKFRFDQAHMFEETPQAGRGESRASERVAGFLEANAQEATQSERAMIQGGVDANAAKKSPAETEEEKRYRAFISDILASSYNDLGVMRAKAAKFAEASEFFERAAVWKPELEGLDRNWGLASYRASLYAQAIPPLERHLNRRPEDALVRQLLGLSYFFTDNYAKSAEVLRPFIANPPADPGLLYAWGVSLVRTRRSSDAAKIFRLLLEQNGSNPEVHLLLGQAYAQQEDYPHALEEIRTALQLDASLPQAHYYAGLVILHQGQLESAADEFRAEVQLQPSDTVAKYHLAYVLMGLGRAAEAIGLLREVVKEKPDYEVAYYEMGRALLQQGDVSGAIENLEKAKKLFPGRDATYYQLSQAYRRAGRTGDAQQALARYRELIETSRQKKRESLETEKP